MNALDADPNRTEQRVICTRAWWREAGERSHAEKVRTAARLACKRLRGERDSTQRLESSTMADEKIDRILELQRAILDELRGMRADVKAAHTLAQKAHADVELCDAQIKAQGSRLHYVEQLCGV